MAEAASAEQGVLAAAWLAQAFLRVLKEYATVHRRRRGYGLTLVLGEEVAVLQPHGAHKRCFVAPPRAEQGYTKAKHSQPSENGRTVNDEPHACPTATPVQRPRLFQGHYSLSNGHACPTATPAQRPRSARASSGRRRTSRTPIRRLRRTNGIATERRTHGLPRAHRGEATRMEREGNEPLRASPKLLC